MSLPQHLVNSYLIAASDNAQIIRFLGYTAILTNLNPNTFAYENSVQNGKRYMWVYHESYGQLTSQYLSQQCALKADLASYAENSLFQISGRSCVRLHQNHLLGKDVVDLNRKYAEREIELLRYHLTMYPISTVTEITEQTTQERKTIEKILKENIAAPWKQLQDISDYHVDAHHYMHLLNNESTWLKSIMIKLLREKYTLEQNQAPIHSSELFTLSYYAEQMHSYFNKQSKESMVSVMRQAMVNRVLKQIEEIDQCHDEIRFKVFTVRQGTAQREDIGLSANPNGE